MIRKIVHIHEDKCTGCGLCAAACHEGAIVMVNGKARLIRDDYCDGMGDCLPECPAGAIEIIEREAEAYDEAAVKARMAALKAMSSLKGSAPAKEPVSCSTVKGATQWPVQIRLVPGNAAFLEGADVLVAADCTAYAYANVHQEFMRGKVTLIGCPKLDDVDYSEKLTQILRQNDIKSVTVLRMEVPCCGGLERAVVTALQNSGKMIPWQVVTFSVDGKILDR